MSDKITELRPVNKSKFGDVMQKALDSMDEETRNLPISSAFVVLDGLNGPAHYNLMSGGIVNIVGLLSVIQFQLIDMIRDDADYYE
jgi:hypothetical protein